MLLPVFIAHVSHASLRRVNATRMLKTHLTFVIMLFIALCLGGGGEQPVHPSLISWFPTLRSMGVCQTGQWSGWVSSTQWLTPGQSVDLMRLNQDFSVIVNQPAIWEMEQGRKRAAVPPFPSGCCW